MQGQALGRAPAIANTVLHSITSLIRMAVSAWFAAAGTALLFMPAAPAALGGLIPPEAAPVAAAALIAAGCTLALGILLAPTTLIVTAYLAGAAAYHLGYAGAVIRPEAALADGMLALLVYLCCAELRRNRRRRPGFRPDRSVPHAPSSPRKSDYAPGYLQALRAAAARWDRAA